MPNRKQLSFDIDTNIVKEILGEKKFTRVYADIRKFMESKDWEHIEGSVYMSKYEQENADVSFLIDALKGQYPYIEKCIKGMHQADILNVHSLEHHFEYDGTPGKYAMKQEQSKSVKQCRKSIKRKSRSRQQTE